MIFTALISIVIVIIGGILSWLPDVTTIPNIAGYNIDAALVSGLGYFYSYATAVWPLLYVLQGLFVLIGYYSIKMLLKFFLGHRSPGLH